MAAWPLIGGLLAALCLFASHHSGRRKRLVNCLPTSKTTGVFIGLSELKGTAEAEAPITSHLAEIPCVYFTWNVDEHWSRTRTETYTDSQGNTQTRTVHESGWTTVLSGGESMNFYLADDCGLVQINPDGATIEPLNIFDETCYPGDDLYYGKGPADAIWNSDHRRRFVEQGIPLHTPLYVMGQARERNDVVAPEIAADPDAPLFLISTRTEEQVSSRMGWAFWLWWIFGGLLCVGGFVVLDRAGSAGGAVHWQWYVLAAAGYLALSGFIWMWRAYNGLVELRQRVRQAWSQVDVQLKRRHDLIPNLVSAVTGSRDYEKNLQTELASLRTQMSATPPGVKGADFQAATPIITAIAERYPELRAHESFTNLQRNLIDTEQRIALARGYFNEIATFYNTRIAVVPDKLIADLGGFKSQDLMTADDFERAPVEVHLAS